MHQDRHPSRWKIILAFGLVYLFWGSTYLGIDIAVQSIPPGLMCAIRFSIAGVVMLAVCAVTGRKIWYSPRQIALASIVGVLLLMGGNLTLSYAELSALYRPRGPHYCHHAIVVPGSGLDAAWPSPHRSAWQSRPCPRRAWIAHPLLP